MNMLMATDHVPKLKKKKFDHLFKYTFKKYLSIYICHILNEEIWKKIQQTILFAPYMVIPFGIDW